MRFGRRWRGPRPGAEAERQSLPPLPVGAGRLQCQVLDPVGLPLAAEISVRDFDGRVVARGICDPYGMFLATVPVGGYQLEVTSDGYLSHRQPVQVAEQASAWIGEIQLDAARELPLPTPGHWELDPAHSAIRFSARHVGLSEIHGRFNNFRGSLQIAEQIERSRIEVAIDAASIDTGMAMRDNHLCSPDFLDVTAHPYITFSGDRFTHSGGSHWTISGALALHGVRRTVHLDTTYLGLGSGMMGEIRAACRATAELHREDFTLTWQKLLTRGIAAIGSTVRVELDMQALPAESL